MKTIEYFQESDAVLTGGNLSNINPQFPRKPHKLSHGTRNPVNPSTK